MPENSNDARLCGLVLAAGEGKRLQPFIRRLRGDQLPKQFVSFVGVRSMLEHTFARAERIAPRESIFTVVGRHHLQFAEVRRQLRSRAPGTVVVQPINRDTGPGILLPLVYLTKRFPDSMVAMFPSDHFILEEARFMGHILAARNAVVRNPSRLILLAVQPEKPEPQYGYVLPEGAGRVFPAGDIKPVSCFIEKPNPTVAEKLGRRGGLWNTLIMVFKARTLLELFGQLAPTLDRVFRRIAAAVGTPQEEAVIEHEYRNLSPLNFSKDLLEVLVHREPGRLAVLPVRGVRWSDWGSEERVLQWLQRMNYKLSFAPSQPQTGLPGCGRSESRAAIHFGKSA